MEFDKNIYILIIHALVEDIRNLKIKNDEKSEINLINIKNIKTYFA